MVMKSAGGRPRNAHNAKTSDLHRTTPTTKLPSVLTPVKPVRFLLRSNALRRAPRHPSPGATILQGDHILDARQAFVLVYYCNITSPLGARYTSDDLFAVSKPCLSCEADTGGSPNGSADQFPILGDNNNTNNRGHWLIGSTGWYKTRSDIQSD